MLKRHSGTSRCCACNRVNARYKSCACVKAGRSCSSCQPSKRNRCSNSGAPPVASLHNSDLPSSSQPVFPLTDDNLCEGLTQSKSQPLPTAALGSSEPLPPPAGSQPQLLPSQPQTPSPPSQIVPALQPRLHLLPLHCNIYRFQAHINHPRHQGKRFLIFHVKLRTLSPQSSPCPFGQMLHHHGRPVFQGRL